MRFFLSLSLPGFLGYLHTHDVLSVLTRCPQCRMELHVPTILSGCYCGNGLINDRSPDDLPALPHSCGRICGRSRGPSGPLPPLQRHHPHEVSLRPHRVSLFPSPHPQTDGALRHRPRHRAL